MKHIYSLLIGAALLALWLPFSYDLTELPLYDLIRTEETKPADPSLKKTRTYLSKSPLRARREGVAALLAPAITATKTYAITTDTGLTGASANDELEYTIIISNSGDTDATGVSFTDQIDANTTLVGGSLKVSPIAQNDSYTTIGNVGIAVTAESGVLTNDYNPGSGSLTITTTSPITTTGNGQVILNTTTGAFTYEPAAGYTGNDTFTYTLDNGSGLTATATVTIAISGKIWFVNNAAASSGTGTLASPFKQMSDFGTANTGATGKPSDNDFIFVYTGSGNYTGSATLRSGQKLIGQGASASLLAITGYTAPSGTSALPATGGTNPVLTTTESGTNALNLGSGNTLRGFTIANTTGSKIAGTNFGTLTATEMTLNGIGQALNLTTGALAATFTSISSTSSAAAGISLSNVTGNLTSTGGTTITNPAAQGIVVNTVSAGTFNFGATSITGSGGTGLSSTGFANTLQFSSLTIDANGVQKAIDITGATGTLNATSGVISDNISIAGASSANTVTLGTTFTSISSTNSTTSGISLSNVTGNLTSTGGTTITNPAAPGIVVNTASSGTFNFGATSITGSGGTGLFSTGFANTLQFSSLTITPDAGRKGIDITGATGTLTIPTGSIVTSNNSALSIAGVSSGSKVTLGVTLNSVSANGSSTHGISLTNTSGTFQIPGSGSTDGSGGTIQNIVQRGAEFINATGITLKNINFISANTSNGCSPLASPTPFAGCYGSVYLESVTNAILDNININSTDGIDSFGSNAQRGITGTGVTGLTISNTVVKNAGNEVKEGAIFLRSLAGTVNFTNLNLLNNPGADDLLRIENYSTSPTITVDGSTFSNTQNSLNGSYGMIVSNYGTGTSNVTVKNSTFDRIRTQGVKGIAEGTGTLNYNIINSSFDPLAGIGSAIDLVSNETGQLNFNILNNPTAKARGTSVINVVSQGSSTAQGRINGNTVTHVGGAGDTGSGIRVLAEGSSKLKVEVKNNNVSGVYEEFGILARSRNGSGRLDAIITGNTVTLPTGNSSLGTNISVEAGTSSSTFTNVTCGYVANNTTTKSTFGQNFFARQATGSHTLILQSGTNATTVWNANGNLPASPPAAIGQGGTIVSGTCQVPENSQPGARMMADAEIEQNQAAGEESVIPLLADSESGTLLPTTPAELVTPVVEEEKPVAEPTPLPIAEKSVTTATRKSAREAATQAAETVTVNGSGSGFTLPAATSVTIKFKVTINSNIPLGTCQVSNQGTVSAAGLTNVLTDDPAVGGDADPTVTPLQSAPVITTAQTAITADADPTTCTASSSFAVAVAGCPTPTVTYKIGATTITSPHAFPVGQTTVDVTVSNGNAPDATSSFTVTVNAVPAPVIEAAGQPDDQTITVGGNASFTVVAQGTGLTYKWQKKVGTGEFTDIPVAGNASAATATLSLTAVPLSESGTQYRCMVSNFCGSSTTSEPATLTVNPLISATISGTTAVCLGEPTQPLITFTGADGTAPYTFTYKINDGPEVEITTTSGNSVTVAQPTGTAGTYVYTLLNVKDAADISLAQSSTATITVNPLPTALVSGTTSVCQGEATQPLITFTGADGTAPYTFTYKINDGSNVEITTTSGNSVTVAQPTGTAGSFVYTLLSVKDATDCNQTQTGTATITIGFPPAMDTDPSVQSVTYGSNATFTVSATNAISYQWQVDAGAGFGNITDGGVYSGATTATLLLTRPTVAMSGYTYRGVAIGGCAPNATSTSATLTVGAKELTATGATAVSRAYDGTTAAAISGATLQGAVNGDDVSLASPQTGTFASKDVNTSIAVTATLALAGADKANYTLTQPTGLSANIIARELTVTGATAENKVYDGTTAAVISGGTLVGVVGSEDVTLATPLTGTFANANAGTDKAVTATLALTGADKANYTLTQPTGLTADIIAIELTVTGATAQDKLYNGTTAAVITGATLQGVVNGDDVSLATPQTGTFASRNVDTDIAVTATLALAGTARDNYTLTQPTGLTADITVRQVNVTAQADTKDYDGTATSSVAPVGGALQAGDTYTTTGTQEFDNKNVGTGKTLTASGAVINDGNNGDNYSISYVPSTNGVINARPITITANSYNKPYCDIDPEFMATVTSGSILDGDVASGSLVRVAGENVGQYAINKGTYTYGTNYNETFVAGTLTITPSPITPLADSYYTGPSFVWTSSPKSGSATFTLSATIKTTTCDIRNARVSFFIRNDDGSKTYIGNAKNLPVGLVDPADLTVGTASAITKYNLGKDLEAETLNIGVEVTGNFTTDGSPAFDGMVTIAAPVATGQIAGGAKLDAEGSSGYIRGRSSAGFGVTYSKGKNPKPKGKVEVRVKSYYNRFGDFTEGTLHTYAIRSNSISGVSVDPQTGKATFDSKANIAEVMNDNSQQAIEGNCVLQITLTDVNDGDPADDELAITLYRNGGGVWYSSNWDGTKTLEKKIYRGNISVSGSDATARENFEVEPSLLTMKVEVVVSPNPVTSLLHVVVSEAGSQPSVRMNLYGMDQHLHGTYEVPVQEGRARQSIDLKNLPDGAYILSVDGAHGRVTRKVLKMN